MKFYPIVIYILLAVVWTNISLADTSVTVINNCHISSDAPIHFIRAEQEHCAHSDSERGVGYDVKDATSDKASHKVTWNVTDINSCRYALTYTPSDARTNALFLGADVVEQENCYRLTPDKNFGCKFEKCVQ